jgi:pimeloyl-ACP methyl ester carboxylesterase
VFGPTSSVATPRIDRYYDAFNAPAARSSALATLRAAVDTRGVVAQTTRIQAPTLVIWGRHDRVWPASFGQRLSREIRGSGFELLDSGHSPHEERPQDIVRIVQRFLSDERRSRF